MAVWLLAAAVGIASGCLAGYRLPNAWVGIVVSTWCALSAWSLWRPHQLVQAACGASAISASISALVVLLLSPASNVVPDSSIDSELQRLFVLITATAAMPLLFGNQHRYRVRWAMGSGIVLTLLGMIRFGNLLSALESSDPVPAFREAALILGLIVVGISYVRTALGGDLGHNALARLGALIGGAALTVVASAKLFNLPSLASTSQTDQPTQLAVTFGFGLIAAGILLHSSQHHRAMRHSAIAALALALLMLALHPAVVGAYPVLARVRDLLSGSSSPSIIGQSLATSISILSAAISLLLLGKEKRGPLRSLLAWLSGVLVMLIASVAGFGYLLNVDMFEHWGDHASLLPLIHAAAFALGFSLLSLADGDTARSARRAQWLPVSAGIMIMVIGVLGWQALLPDEVKRVEFTTERLAQSMVRRVTDALQHYADLAETRADPNTGLGTAASEVVIAAGDSMEALSMAIAQHGRYEPSRLLAALPAVADVSALPPGHWNARVFDLDDDRFLWLNHPASDASQGLNAILQLDTLLSFALTPAPDGYSLELTSDQHVVKTVSAEYANDARWSRRVSSLWGGLEWSIRLTPTVDTLGLMTSRLPGTVLLAGMLLGGLLALALRLAFLSRERAHAAELVSAGLRREVDARLATERALERSLDEIGLILSSITDGFVFLDRDLAFTYANDRAGRLLGDEPDHLTGHRITEIWPELAIDGSELLLRQALDGQITTSFESNTHREDRWLDVRAYSHPEGLALFIRDVTQDRLSAQQLALSEAFLRHAQRLADVGSWRVETTRDQWLWSDQLYRILGIDVAAAPSLMLILQRTHGEDRAQLQAAFNALAQSGKALDIEHRLQLDDERTLRVHSRAEAERDAEGRIIALSGTLQDITARKAQELALSQALERAERHARQLRALNRVSLMASSHMGDEGLLQQLLDEIRDAVGTHLASLHLLPAEPGGNLLPTVSLSDKYAKWRTFSAPVQGLGLLALSKRGAGVLRLNESQLISHPAFLNYSRHATDHPPLRALLSVPMRDHAGHCLGFLQFSDPVDHDEFSNDDETIAVQFAQVIAITLVWRSLINELHLAHQRLTEQVTELTRSRALLANAERVAGLGTWEFEFGDITHPVLRGSEQMQRLVQPINGVMSVVNAMARIHPEDLAKVRDDFIAATQGKIGINHDLRLCRDDQSYIWVHAQAELVRDERGNPSRLVGTLHDITEMREEQEIEHERANILRSVASGQSLHDTASLVIQSFESRHQKRKAIIVAHPDAELPIALVAPSFSDDFFEVAEPFVQGLADSATGFAANTRQRVIVTDIQSDDRFPESNKALRSLGFSACCATPIIAPDERLLGVFTVYHRDPHVPDKNELKAIDAVVALLIIASNAALAQRRLEESRQRLRSLFTLVPDAVLVLDTQGIIADCNEAALRLLRADHDALQGTAIEALVSEQDRVTIDEHVTRAAMGETLRFDHSGQRLDGTRFDAVTTTLPITVDGQTVGVYAAIVDITEQRSAQVALSAALQDVQSRNRELQDFAFVASHDLQEPLRKVQAFGDRLRTHLGEQLDADSADYIERMRSAAARMQALINDLLAYSRVSRNAHAPSRVDLNQIARDVLGDLETRIEGSRATVEINALPTVSADPVHMHQLLQNLIGNSLKFIANDRPPRITLRAEFFERGTASNPERWVRLILEDNGIGFENRYLDRIFSPFQRLHGRSQYEGSGIGLAIVRKIIERHGGQIRADGRPGLGATFVVELPINGQPLSNEAGVWEDAR